MAKPYRKYEHERPFLEFVQGGVRVRQATNVGYAFCPIGGCFDISYPSSKMRRARVQEGGGIAPAITCGVEHCLVIMTKKNKQRHADDNDN